MMKNYFCKTAFTFLLCLGSVWSYAKPVLSALFSDNMVLQQNTQAPIWGEATPGKQVKITPSWSKETISVPADETGKWKTSLPTPAAGGPYTITISDGKKIQLSNVMIGEVWICSGQSNMEMPLAGWGKVLHYEQEIAAADHPDIRLFQIKKTTSLTPSEEVQSTMDGWQPCAPETVENFSSVAYFYARELNRELGVPVVPITARTGEGLDELLEVAHRQMHLGYTFEPDDLYDEFTHDIHHRMGELIHDAAYAANLPAHWASIKLLEGDEIVSKALNLPQDTQKKLDQIIAEYEASSDLGDRETLIADSRYQYIERVVKASVVRGQASGPPTLSQRIDRIVTGKYTALPLFLCAMLVMFVITFGPFGSWLQDGVSALIDLFSGFLRDTMTAGNVSPVLISLVCDGIIAGVGGVLSFLPQIALLFFFLSFLEDSGYMSRAAFIMDRLLRRFGLSGKAFIPMLMGFGCSVPAIMGARTMENEKDRRMTILLIPFMSCSAKLPVYGMIAGAFFGPWAGLVVFGLYVIGMLVGILSGIFFKHTLFAGEPAPFVLELPPYRLPSMENIATHVWQKVKGFLIKAGTLILLMSMILWLLQSLDFSLHMVDDASASMLGVIGGWIALIFAPMGFGFWQAAVALLTGLIAKEMVVSSLSMFYGFALTATSAQVAAAMTGFTPLAAFSMLVFILLYVPCVAAVSTLAREMQSTKWTLFSIAWQLGVAYVASLLVHTIGVLLGLG